MIPLRMKYAQASPYELLPLNTQQVLITEELDTVAPVEMMQNYLDKALQLGDKVNLISIKDSGHFELIASTTAAFKIMQNQIFKILHLTK
jgi:hypothetical protein